MSTSSRKAAPGDENNMDSLERAPPAFQGFMATVMRPVITAGEQSERIDTARSMADLDDADLLFVLAATVSGDKTAAAIVAVLRERARSRVAGAFRSLSGQ